MMLLSLTAGLKVLLSHSHKGVLLLIINYSLQLVQFKYKGFYFFYATGPYLGCGLAKNSNGNITFWWDGSEFIINVLIKIVEDKLGWFITINFLALALIPLLFEEYKNRKKLKS
ncbi:MAG: hypothetical protein ACWA6U_17810 [Breznakibacter sp.]